MIVQRITKGGSIYNVNMDPAVKVAKYFTLKELANNEGDAKKPQFIDSPLSEILRCILDDYRSWLKKPVVASCCHRQSAYNAKVGGIAGSLHCFSQAADLQFANMTDTQWNNIKTYMVKEFRKYGVVGELIRYSWGFHVGVGVTYQKTDYIGDKR